jgi:ABC-type antimicrobial peptide transport system permease subunit
VGIADNHNKSIYADSFYSRMLRLGSTNYRKISDVEASVTSLNDNEILTNENSPQKGVIGGTINVSNNSFTIKGYFSDEDPTVRYVVNENALRTMEIETSLLAGQGFYLYSENIEETTSGIRGDNIEVTSAYEESLRTYKRENLMINTVLIFITGTVLAAALFYLYFLMRSSLISRITEIGIYRALGFTKGDIYVMFIAEIVAITSLTSIPGFILANLMIAKLNSVSFIPIFKMNILTLGSGILLIFILNLLTGLLPVFTLLRHTPREIISKYDI